MSFGENRLSLWAFAFLSGDSATDVYGQGMAEKIISTPKAGGAGDDGAGILVEVVELALAIKESNIFYGRGL